MLFLIRINHSNFLKICSKLLSVPRPRIMIQTMLWIQTMKSHRQLIPEAEIEEILTYFRHPNTTLIIRLTSLMDQLQDVIVKKIVLLFKITLLLLCFNFEKMFEFYEFYIDSLFEA